MDQIMTINDITILEIYLYYDYFNINYTLNNKKYNVMIEYDVADEIDEIEKCVGDHLHKMIHLESFSYTSRFYSETSHSFLTTKPDSLKTLELDNMQALDLNFLVGITHLTLTDLDKEIISKIPLLPKSIKNINILNDSSDLLKKTTFPHDLTIQLID